MQVQFFYERHNWQLFKGNWGKYLLKKWWYKIIASGCQYENNGSEQSKNQQDICYLSKGRIYI